ncbi:hypothetical protein ADUPG1_011695 [Aduncisulcus paluster]|uniref:Uncharacterized protein n=1 Tax=Aduncisulcus paluster TaxID=2918883 RepID=A0ABQ5JZ23_9EUKA|nr:hypothetical protein ADUPG1_011695 [Aduncisulcus paluster]
MLDSHEATLNVDSLSDVEITDIIALEEEQARKNDMYELLFPLPYSAGHTYLKLFPSPRVSNVLLCKWLDTPRKLHALAKVRRGIPLSVHPKLKHSYDQMKKSRPSSGGRRSSRAHRSARPHTSHSHVSNTSLSISSPFMDTPPLPDKLHSVTDSPLPEGLSNPMPFSSSSSSSRLDRMSLPPRSPSAQKLRAVSRESVRKCMLSMKESLKDVISGGLSDVGPGSMKPRPPTAPIGSRRGRRVPKEDTLRLSSSGSYASRNPSNHPHGDSLMGQVGLSGLGIPPMVGVGISPVESRSPRPHSAAATIRKEREELWVREEKQIQEMGEKEFDGQSLPDRVLFE